MMINYHTMGTCTLWFEESCKVLMCINVRMFV